MEQKAPKKVYRSPRNHTFCRDERHDIDDTEYIRADIHQTKIRELVEACEAVITEIQKTPDFPYLAITGKVYAELQAAVKEAKAK